jgi:hypothetical protein
MKDFLAVLVCLGVPIFLGIFGLFYITKNSPISAPAPVTATAPAPATATDKAWDEKRFADNADEYCRELGTGPSKPMLYIECMKKRENMMLGIVIFPDGHGGTFARQY